MLEVGNWAVFLAAAALLVYSYVYLGPKVMAADKTSPIIALTPSEHECDVFTTILVETYNAAANVIPIEDVVDHINSEHLDGAPDRVKAVVLQYVNGVYQEFPDTTLGEQAITECYAHAKKEEVKP
jgi:hypothetical protein